MGIIKCTNCGADINENSSFCGECGHKVERTENKDVEPEKLNDIITTDNEHKNTDSTEKKDAELKVPFYLSGWFIFLMAFIASFFTLGITYIVAIVLACIRRSKFKDKKLNNNLILGGLIAPIAIVIIIFVILLISTIAEERQIKTYIESGQYEEAVSYIEDKYTKGGNSYVKNMLEVYEAQDDYDGAALFILDEIASDELLAINPDFIAKLKIYVNHTSDDVTEKINDKLSDIEEAKKAKEEADKKAKEEADKKAKEEATQKVKEEETKENKKINEEKQTFSNDDNQTKEQKKASLGEFQSKLKELGYDDMEVESLTDAEADSIYTQTMNELNTYGKSIAEIREELKNYKDFFGLSEKEVDALSDYKVIWYYGDIFYGEGTSDYGAEDDYYSYPVVKVKDILRYPEQYEGQKVRMTVFINYPFDSVDINNSYFYASQVLEYNWNINLPVEYGENVVLYDRRTEGVRLLKDDIVEIFGTCRGIKAFTKTTIGGVQSEEGVVQIDVEYSELIKE